MNQVLGSIPTPFLHKLVSENAVISGVVRLVVVAFLVHVDEYTLLDFQQ